MNRRDFLLLRKEKKERIMELSCQRLYMRYVDGRAGAARMDDVGEEEPAWWNGEPPTVVRQPTCQELFQDLERTLAEVDVLRITDSDWLASQDFSRELAQLVASFRDRGGRVESAEEGGQHATFLAGGETTTPRTSRRSFHSPE